MKGDEHHSNTSIRSMAPFRLRRRCDLLLQTEWCGLSVCLSVGLSKGDEHPTNTPHGICYSYLLSLEWAIVETSDLVHSYVDYGKNSMLVNV